MNNVMAGQKIVFFCAHPDDDTFSSGALIYDMAKKGKDVVCIYLTSSPRGVAKDIPDEEKRNIRKTEAEDACKVIGARPIFLDLDKPRLEYSEENVRVIKQILENEKPDAVFLPIENDAHPTHAKVSKIVLKALESFEISEAWFYETWTPLANPDFIFFFGEDLMKIKVKAMEQHKSQLDRIDLLSATVALNRFRGITGRELLGGFAKVYTSGEKYGEAFQKARSDD